MTQPPRPGPPPTPAQPPYGQGPYGQPTYGTPQPPKKPLYKRTWFLVVAAIIVVGIIGSAVSANKKSRNDAASNPPSNTAAATKASTTAPSQVSSTAAAKSTGPTSGRASQGFGSKDASGDLKVSKLIEKSDGLGGKNYTVQVVITNHSSKRSDYAITIALESADGTTQIDTTNLFEQNIEPGQTKTDSGNFLSVEIGDAKVTPGAKIVVQEIQRTESF